MRLLLILTTLLLSLAVVGAAPQINLDDNPTTLVDLGSYTIQGSDFGFKESGPPARWEDFDDGELNTTFNEPDWYMEYDVDTYCYPHYSEQQMRDGTYSIAFCQEHTDGKTGFQDMNTGSLDSGGRIFFSTYIYVPTSPAYVDEYKSKMWYVHSGEGDGWTQYPQIQVHDYFTGSGVTYRERSCDISSGTLYNCDYVESIPGNDPGRCRDWFGGYAHDEWVRIQVEFDSGDYDTWNGLYRHYINNVISQDFPAFEPDPFKFLCNDDPQIDNVMFGYWWGRDDGYTDTKTIAFYDDIYVDTTWARIEICDKSTYDDYPIHCEIQIPSEWSESSISFEANKGIHNIGEELHLFVIDEDGVSSENGYPIQFGNPTPGVPSITDINNDEPLTDGGSFTITGSDFGTEGLSSLFKWEDFEGFPDGTPVTAGGWSVYNQEHPNPTDAPPEYSSSRSYGNSQQSGWSDISDGGLLCPYLVTSPTLSYYVSYNFYYDYTTLTGVQKGMRVHPSSCSYGCEPAFRVQDFSDDYRLRVYPIQGDSFYAGYPGNLLDNQWVREEYWLTLSDPAGSENGVVEYSRDSQLLKSWMGDSRYSSTPDATWGVVMLPLAWAGSANFWYDNVYISSSRARIEICDQELWDNTVPRHCEIQVPQYIWSENSIQFTANQGVLNPGEELFLFVIDEDGNVNENGFSIEFSNAIPQTIEEIDQGYGTAYSLIDLVLFSSRFLTI